jgi:hypothetical protein
MNLMLRKAGAGGEQAIDAIGNGLELITHLSRQGIEFLVDEISIAEMSLFDLKLQSFPAGPINLAHALCLRKRRIIAEPSHGLWIR